MVRERRDKEISSFLRIVLPPVIIKTVYEKNFIVVEAKKCLAHCVENFP